jgi:hypothetical protein
VLLSRYLDALRSGQAQGLADFARQFPDDEAELLELLPGLVALEGLKIPAPKELERLGEFERRHRDPPPAHPSHGHRQAPPRQHPAAGFAAGDGAEEVVERDFAFPRGGYLVGA